MNVANIVVYLLIALPVLAVVARLAYGIATRRRECPTRRLGSLHVCLNVGCRHARSRGQRLVGRPPAAHPRRHPGRTVLGTLGGPKQLGTHEFRQRWSNINKVRRW